MDFYHSPVAVWVNSAPQPKRWGPRAHRGSQGTEPNTVVSCAPIGEWIVPDCFVTCCKTWQSLSLTKKSVIYTTMLAWSQHDLSKVAWYHITNLTWFLLQHYCMKSASSRNHKYCPTQEAKRVMMHTHTVSDFTQGNRCKTYISFKCSIYQL